MPVGAGARTPSRRAAPYTSLREWRALAVAGKTPTDVVLRKAYTCEKIATVDASLRQKQFVISTASVDREGDTVAPEGWVLQEYERNPVVLWAHDGEEPPIGQTIRMGVDTSRKLVSVAQFAPREVYEFADTIYQLVDGGYIRAASVGFLPIEFQFDAKREGTGFAPPCNFLRQTLLEWSVCPVPANPDCLLQARSAGIELAPLLDWAERILDEGHGQPGVWISRAEAAAVHKLLGTTTHSLPAFRAAPAAGTAALAVRTLPFNGQDFVDLVDELVAAAERTDDDPEVASAEPVERDLVLRPYPSEHACRLADPDGFDKFRRGQRDHDGKSYSVIYARPKEGDGGWQEQAYRYPKETWDAKAASAHCDSHGGTFEAAKAADAPPVHAKADRAPAPPAPAEPAPATDADASAADVAAAQDPPNPPGEGAPVARALDPLERLAAIVDEDPPPDSTAPPAAPVARAAAYPGEPGQRPDPEDSTEGPEDNGPPDPEDVAEGHARKALATAQAAVSHLNRAVEGMRRKAAAPLDPAHHLHTAKGYMDLAAAHAGMAHGAINCACGAPGVPMTLGAPEGAVETREPPGEGVVVREVVLTQRAPAPPEPAPPSPPDDEDVLADLDPAEVRAMVQAGVEASIETRMRLAAGRVD